MTNPPDAERLTMLNETNAAMQAAERNDASLLVISAAVTLGLMYHQRYINADDYKDIGVPHTSSTTIQPRNTFNIWARNTLLSILHELATERHTHAASLTMPPSAPRPAFTGETCH